MHTRLALLDGDGTPTEGEAGSVRPRLALGGSLDALPRGRVPAQAVGDRVVPGHGRSAPPGADLALACLGLRRTASLCPLYGSAHCFHTIMQGVVTPEARRAAPASRPPAFIVDASCLGVGPTGKPAG